MRYFSFLFIGCKTEPLLPEVTYPWFYKSKNPCIRKINCIYLYILAESKKLFFFEIMIDIYPLFWYNINGAWYIPSHFKQNKTHTIP